MRHVFQGSGVARGGRRGRLAPGGTFVGAAKGRKGAAKRKEKERKKEEKGRKKEKGRQKGRKAKKKVEKRKKNEQRKNFYAIMDSQRLPVVTACDAHTNAFSWECRVCPLPVCYWQSVHVSHRLRIRYKRI